MYLKLIIKHSNVESQYLERFTKLLSSLGVGIWDAFSYLAFSVLFEFFKWICLMYVLFNIQGPAEVRPA